MEFNNIDLNAYKTFYTVAKAQSFSKASELLFISQPAISVSIKKLEDQLNVKLFKRDNKGIQLTENGKKLYFYVESVLNTLSTAERKLKEDKNLSYGEIRLGVPTHIGIFLINEMIFEFKTLYPGIKFRIENRPTRDMLKMLEKREIDMIIDNAPIDSNLVDMEVTNLIKFDNCFAADKKYAKLATEAIDFITLNKYQLLLPAERTSTRISLEKEVKKEKQDLTLKPIIEVSTTEMMYDLVKKGLGIGYFTKMSVIEDLVNRNLFEIKTKSVLPQTEICLAYLPDFLTNASLQFIKFIKKQITKKKIRSNKELRLITTKKCNYNCAFCHHEGIKCNIEEKLNSDDILSFYQFLNNTYDISSIHLTGGEPFLNNELSNIIKKTKAEKAEITITSNGYNINPNDEIFNQIDKINISIHTLDENMYEEISKVKGSFKKTLNNIIELRKNFPLLKIGINTTLTKFYEHNEEELINLIEFSKSIRADIKIIELFPNSDKENFVNISTIIPTINSKHYNLKKSAFRKEIYENDGHQVILIKCTCSAVSEQKKGDKSKYCYENNDIYLSADGNLHICRNTNDMINIYKEIKNKDYYGLKIKLEEYFESLGKNCIYSKVDNNE